MNIRVLLHVINGVAGALAAGTVVFHGLSENMAANVVSVAALVVIATSIYMASTTMGTARPPTPPEHNAGEGDIP